MLKPIKNNQQYEDALARAYALLQKILSPIPVHPTNWKFFLF
jgi:hypothetical protein